MNLERRSFVRSFDRLMTIDRAQPAHYCSLSFLPNLRLLPA